jgi:hypothetical protein
MGRHVCKGTIAKSEIVESGKDTVRVKAFYCKCGNLVTIIPGSRTPMPPPEPPKKS